MKSKVIAMYEDSPGEQVANFGPHSLALATLADRLSVTRWHLKPIQGMPMKGATKALERAQALAGVKATVLLLLDEDRIRDQLQLPGDAPDAVVRARLTELCPGIVIVLLVRNVEDLVAQASRALHRPVPETKPTPAERDAVLNALADSPNRTERAQVTTALRSWGQWIDELEAAARTAGFP